MARVKRPQKNPLRHYRRELTIDTVDTNTHNVSKYVYKNDLSSLVGKLNWNNQSKFKNDLLMHFHFL